MKKNENMKKRLANQERHKNITARKKWVQGGRGGGGDAEKEVKKVE